MFRNGRSVDQQFSSNEPLFFRCKSEWIDSGRLKSAYIRFPDQSVNRAKYSKASDVLIPDTQQKSRDWIYWGVAQVNVNDIPSPTQSIGGVAYKFTVEHDPVDDNYGHSELRVYKGKDRVGDTENVNKGIKKEYRAELAKKTRICIMPLI
jgi:hypothetical protein